MLVQQSAFVVRFSNLREMSGKGAKGLIMGKTPAANKDKDKDKKKPVSRSSRAGLQVFHSSLISSLSVS